MPTIGAARPAVEQVVGNGAAVPEGMQLGRCRSHDIGVAWPAGTAKLDEMVCPLCSGPLVMTTRRLRRRFHLVDRAAARTQARRARAATKAAIANRVAAGDSKYARELAAGDVLHPTASRSGRPVRVVEVDLPGHYKSHVGVRVQTSLQVLRVQGRADRDDELGCRLLSLPAGAEVRLAGELAGGLTCPASVGEVRVAVAERELTFAERMLAGAERRLAEEGDEGYRAGAVGAWTSRVATFRTELDAARAALAEET
jgi:hypothetical protein